MNYSYELTVATSDTDTNPASVSAKLGAGNLREVVIDFPAGCNKHVRACVYDREEQILPSNQDGYYSFNNFTHRASIYKQLTSDNNIFTFYAWSVDASWDHLLTVVFDVEDPNAPNIFRVVEGLEEILGRWIDLLRRLF